MRTDTSNRKGRSQARHVSTTWRDDDWTVAGDYEELQPEFNPEVGFVRRPDASHYSTDLSWRPRPGPSTWLRNYVVGSTADYYQASSTGDLQTRQQSLSGGLAFQSGASIIATGTNTFDRLVAPFAIRPGVTIPTGDYQYPTVAVNYSSDQSRRISGSTNVSRGNSGMGEAHRFPVP